MIYILWSSDYASYLEDYLMEKRCTWGNGSLWLKDRPCKIYVGQWPIFHGPLILPYIIVRLKLFLYIKKWHGGDIRAPPGTCCSYFCEWILCKQAGVLLFIVWRIVMRGNRPVYFLRIWHAQGNVQSYIKIFQTVQELCTLFANWPGNTTSQTDRGPRHSLDRWQMSFCIPLG